MLSRCSVSSRPRGGAERFRAADTNADTDKKRNCCAACCAQHLETRARNISVHSNVLSWFTVEYSLCSSASSVACRHLYAAHFRRPPGLSYSGLYQNGWRQSAEAGPQASARGGEGLLRTEEGARVRVRTAPVSSRELTQTTFSLPCRYLLNRRSPSVSISWRVGPPTSLEPSLSPCTPVVNLPRARRDSEPVMSCMVNRHIILTLFDQGMRSNAATPLALPPCPRGRRS